MSKTIDISVENNGTDVIIVSLERVGVDVGVGNVERSITVDFGSLPQNIYWDEILDKPNFHEVATSGDYNDLENLPDIKPVATSGNYNDLTNKPDLKPVATSGDYDDLSDKPKINDVTLSGNKTAADLHLATDTQGAKADTAYQKPSGGIPKSDLSSGVQSSLDKADTALQQHQSLDGYATESWVEDQGYLTQHQDISGKEDKANKVTSLSSGSTDTQYPSAKVVYDQLATKQAQLVSGTNIKTINGESILGSGNIVIQGGGGGTGDYEELDNLPSINNVELIGNKTASDLGLQAELTIDATPTSKSTNPVQSGGVYDALQDKVDKVQLATTNDIATLGANGNIKDSGVSIGSVAMDAAVVHKSGDETISGEKTFADKTIFNNEIKLIDDNEIGAKFYSSEEGKIEFYGSPSSGTVQLKHITSPSVSSDAATKGYVDGEVAGKQDTITDLADIRSGAALGATSIQSSEKGAASGVATLDSGGKVPQSQLPSYVDDVLEYANLSSFPATGESGKIYVALDTNKTYRWSGSAYVEISQSLALGETSSTAFAGDRGKAIEDKIPSSASSSNKLATASDVNGKLNAPATAGTSGQVLTSDGQGGQSWQTPQSGGVTDVTVGGTSVVSGGVAAVPAIPTVPTISTDIASDATSDTKTTSPKAVKTFVENKGYGTYSKPSGGIPASDLASGVIPNSVVNATSQQDGTVVLTKVNGDTITIDLNHVHPQYYSKEAEITQPSGGMLPDVIYKLGTLTGATTFTFAAAVSGNLNHYYFTFTSGSTAVVPTWPASITSWDGNCVDSTTGLPVIAASKTYEVSVIDGNAFIKEW